MSQQIHNKQNLKEIRKQLRNNATKTEELLWQHLKDKKLGEKFRRQHSVANYVLDFYCPIKRLCIELDGSHHFTEEGKDLDKGRDITLAEYNINVLRFTNSEIERDIQSVLNTIKHYLQ
jgi:very-short-patch-repair endonuclease